MYFVFKINPPVLILFTLLTNSLYPAFLITSFSTMSLSLLKSAGTGLVYQYLVYLLSLLN